MKMPGGISRTLGRSFMKSEADSKIAIMILICFSIQNMTQRDISVIQPKM